MKKTKILVLGICLSFCSVPAYASDVGVTGAQFLKIGTGARPMGMAGAFGAIADDGYAAYWNPAGFARLKGKDISTTFIKYFEDVSYGYLGYSSQHAGVGVFGVSISYVAIRQIEKRTADTEFPDSKFSANDMCFAFSYALKEPFEDTLPGVDLGLNLKAINQKIDDESAATAAVDLGAFYQTALEPLTIGVVVQNIGPGQKFIDERDPLPLNLKLSGAYRFFDETLIVGMDVDEYIIDRKMYASLGCEYWIKNTVALRTGYRYGYHRESLGGMVGLAGGASFRALNFQLDYAFLPFGDLGDTHRFSFSVKF